MAPIEKQRPQVVILGGGFGGLYAARSLRRAGVAVTIIDRRNHHLFQPLLYQVATAALNPSEVAAPIRALVPKRETRVLLASAERIDTAAKKVILDDGGEVPFDFLIVATGATHSYFGKDEWAQVAPGLKSVEDALQMRRKILLAFERAERESDPAKRRALMTFVIVGAGPTGVELAGALAEISRDTLAHDFQAIDPREARILLVEGLQHVLPVYPESLSKKARAALERLGVEVRTGTRVTALDAGGVDLDGERLEAATVLWAAGVAASPLGKTLGVPLDRAGRVVVSPQLTIPGHDDIFVIGDLAHFEQDGKPVPGVAPAAMQQGRHTARNIARVVRGGALQPFRYRDKGSFAVIGRGAAVGMAFGARFTGFIAWLAWLFIHLMYLAGFRSRLVVLVNWAHSFLTMGRSARLITYEDGAAASAAAPLTPAPSDSRSSRRAAPEARA